MAKHQLYIADARRASELISSSSIDLVVTGPPYWNEVIYSKQPEQLSNVNDYKLFLSEITEVWQECSKLLKPGGILAFWVHDLYRSCKKGLQYIPLHADLIEILPSTIKLRQISVWDRYLSRIRQYILKRGKGGTRYQYYIICQKGGQHSSNQKLIQESLLKEFWKPIWYFKTTPKLLGSRLLFRVAFKTIAPFSDKLKSLKKRGLN